MRSANSAASPLPEEQDPCHAEIDEARDCSSRVPGTLVGCCYTRRSRLLFLVLWIAGALVLSGWLTWALQAAAEGHRRGELQAWCDRRSRSLAQHVQTTYNILQAREWEKRKTSRACPEHLPGWKGTRTLLSKGSACTECPAGKSPAYELARMRGTHIVAHDLPADNPCDTTRADDLQHFPAEKKHSARA